MATKKRRSPVIITNPGDFPSGSFEELRDSMRASFRKTRRDVLIGYLTLGAAVASEFNWYTRQRPFHSAWADRLAEAMKKGIFFDYASTLVYSYAGDFFYDGQHRAGAIIRSGLPQHLILKVTKNAKAFPIIDGERRRTVADLVFAMTGIRMSVAQARALVHHFMEFAYAVRMDPMPRASLIVSNCLGYRWDYLQRIGSHNAKVLVNASAIRCMELDADQALPFFEALNHGTPYVGPSRIAPRVLEAVVYWLDWIKNSPISNGDTRGQMAAWVVQFGFRLILENPRIARNAWSKNLIDFCAVGKWGADVEMPLNRNYLNAYRRGSRKAA